MDTDVKVRQHVSLGQLKGLIDFLQDHKELAKGLTRGRRGKLHSGKQWNLCAKKLNVYKDGVYKDGSGWSKYWCDWKYRVRRRAMELKAAIDSNRPPPEGITPLSSMEKTILSIIGEASIDNVVIKTDPLGEDSDEGAPDNNEEILSNECYATSAEPVKFPERCKRRNSSIEELDLEDHGGPSSSPVHHIPRKKTKFKDDNDSDNEDTTKFLRIEKEKLKHARKLHENVHLLTSEVTRLADIMGDIRDALLNNRLNMGHSSEQKA